MSYATTSDLELRLAPDFLAALADENADGSPEGDILEAALDDASAEMDSFLAARFATPVSPVPDSLLRVCADLAIYYLYLRRREAVSQECLRRASEARDRLRGWAIGEENLEGATPRLARMKSDSLTMDQEKSFDRSTLEPY